MSINPLVLEHLTIFIRFLWESMPHTNIINVHVSERMSKCILPCIILNAGGFSFYGFLFSLRYFCNFDEIWRRKRIMHIRVIIIFSVRSAAS